ncbi:MAG: TonB-dependent receptor, partial [Opitutaceae bacterium]|nr:TonB-dependent receptor [Opitutaceae bacterium]
EYAGYTENFKSNGGKAKIKGLELSYEQQLAFLPKPLNGLKLALNYTLLRTDGDYGDAGERRSTKEVQNFIPSTANARLSYRYKWLSVSVAANYTDDSLMSYATDPAQLRFKKSRTWIDVNTSVKLSRHMDLFVLLGNVTNEPFIYYRGIANRRQGTIYNGPTVSLGIGGRF